MRLLGGRTQTYLLVNGFSIPRPIALAPGIDLLPVKLPPGPELVLSKVEEPLDVHIISIFLPYVDVQLRVQGTGKKDVALRAWNAMWDVLLLSAIYNAPTACALQSTAALENFGETSRISVIHYSFEGHPRSIGERALTEEDATWLESNFMAAQELLQDHRFKLPSTVWLLIGGIPFPALGWLFYGPDWRVCSTSTARSFSG